MEQKCVFYVQLDANNICVGVSQLRGKVEAENMIEIPTYDISLFGKRYNNGDWLEVPKGEQEPQPTEQDLLNAQLLLNQTEQDAKLKSIDEALSLVLLNQEGGI